MLGDGGIDIPRVLAAIEEICYEGFVTVELYTYEEKAREAALTAFQYLMDWQSKQTTRSLRA
jgi:sugar phosphate isomerase/epimerase